jgi:hypothetical protein
MPSPGARAALRWLVVLLAAVAAGAVAVRVAASVRRGERRPEPVRAATALGDSTCLSCHRDKAGFERTAHRLTTRHPTRDAILGSVGRDDNELRTTNRALHFRVHADSTGFYQTAVVGTGADTTSRTERIAIVVGSGRKGQSYLYWAGDRLFQLPVSYWASLGRWINSPGPAYVDGRPNFDRAVAPRCLECHATWIEARPSLTEVNQYRPESAILGITCERCHAAGREHVARERSVLHAIRAPAIVNPARLDRVRQMEACAQCHGGLGAPTAPSFSYVAGRPLDDYLTLPPQASDATVDVHGNQAALLARSRCYRASTMTCLTCHDVHREQRDLAQLSGRCLTCHQERSCGLFATQGHALTGRCVTCHMPVQASNLIVSSLEGSQERAQVRTHWIRVYPQGAGTPGSGDASGRAPGPATSPPDRRATTPPAAAPR